MPKRGQRTLIITAAPPDGLTITSSPVTVGMMSAAVAALAPATVPALADGGKTTQRLSSYRITGASTAKAGTVTFKVRNASQIEHEMVVIRTSRKASQLRHSGGRASEQGSVGEAEVAGGRSTTLTLHLKKGHYALICNIGDHYDKGMRRDFTVT